VRPRWLVDMAVDRSPVGLVEFIAKAIVNNPDSVVVTEVDDGRLLELETDAEDRGRVIGRQGRVAKAIRAVLGASRDGADCRLDIVD
jgi:predicted RNA-binding protein YlqC (UPF0109 family)